MHGRPLRVVVVGQGYVGLPLAMRAVAVGHDVVGFDVSVDRVKRLAAGESFVEDVPPADRPGGARQRPLPRHRQPARAARASTSR